MEETPLSTLSALSFSQKKGLNNGKVFTISELLLIAPTEAAKKCKLNLMEIQNIIDIVCKERIHDPQSLAGGGVPRDGESFTTGDIDLDSALGGGVRTGMVWEIVGQSAAGKTQFGLQLSLTVQLSSDEGGLSGSACYLTTSSKLPTNRLLELAQHHPRLSSSQCGLSGVQTLSTPNIPLLIHVLSVMVPKLILDQSSSSKPIKLLVVDALAELFHSSSKTTTQTLVERSRNINEISNLLHCLASQHNIAILVLNEVSDAFNRGYGVDSDADLVYSDQSQWFARADSIPGEDSKEASLGLVWANQVNVRIMVSRTGRRRYVDGVRSVGTKIRKTNVGTSSSPNTESGEETSTLIRRLSVIFSSVAPAVSLDYIVTTEGVTVLADDVPAVSRKIPPVHPIQAVHTEIKHPAIDPVPSQKILSQVSPLDVGCVEDANKSAEVEQPVDEWDAYWEQDEASEAPYNSSEVDEILSQLNS